MECGEDGGGGTASAMTRMVFGEIVVVLVRCCYACINGGVVREKLKVERV